MDLKEIGYVN